MDANPPRRRFWAYVVALTGVAMIAGATAGAASSDDDGMPAASPALRTQSEVVQQRDRDCPAEGGDRRRPRQTATLDPV